MTTCQVTFQTCSDQIYFAALSIRRAEFVGCCVGFLGKCGKHPMLAIAAFHRDHKSLTPDIEASWPNGHKVRTLLIHP